MSSNIEVEETSYTVLYYKRKAQKIHKSKGVSKMDGKLTLRGKEVSLYDDDSNVVYKKLNPEIAKRSLQEEEILVLGNLEVEVFERIRGSSIKSKPAIKTKSTISRPLVMRRPLHPSRGPSLLPATSSIAVAKKGFQRRIIRPLQPKQAATKCDSDDLPRTEKENMIATSGKRPLLLQNRKPIMMQKVRKLSTTSNPSEKTSSNFFPGAVGNLDVPHSIKTVLKPHQIEGVSFLWNCLAGNAKICQHTSSERRKGAILADEMGLGKSLMSIAVICGLHRQKRNRRFVVVCPSSLVRNWAMEFDKWLGKASQPKRVVIQKGGAEAKKQIKAWVGKVASEVLIISYDLFRLNIDLLQNIQRLECLVVDEGHKLKNASGSLTMDALQKLPTESRLCITATPVQNVLSDFYTLANFTCPGLLGSLQDFRQTYERPISAGNEKKASFQKKHVAKQASRRLQEITSTFLLRRLQKDILRTMLPPRTELLLFCRPSRAQCQMYKQIASTVEDNGSDALTTLTKLRKLCLHPNLIQKNDNFASTTKHASGKVQVLDALLQRIRTHAPSDKVVIVSNFTSALTVIEKVVLKPRYLSYTRLDGTTLLQNRQSIVDTFNNTSAQKEFCFLLSSKAGGCGLNLIGANRLIMFDPDWNPAADIQAMARVYRQGQTKPCWIYRMFTSGTIEEVICQRQIQKGNLFASDPSESRKISFTKQELKDCFTLKENCDCDTKRKIGNKWPEYTGYQGEDQPLRTVASDSSTPLIFIHHVVEDSKETFKMNNIENASLPDDDSSDEEEEFEFEDLPFTAKPQALKLRHNDNISMSSGNSEEDVEF